MWLHIFGTGQKNVAEPIAGKHLDGTESAILCLWNGCTSKLPMLTDSLKRHIQAQHLHMTVECTWCNVNRREDSYKTSHRPARFCEHRPEDQKKCDEIWARRPPAAVPSTALPSAAGPVRTKRTRAPRKKAQKAIAYPSPTDVSGSILHQGRRADQRSIRPRPVAGPDLTTSLPVEIPNMNKGGSEDPVLLTVLSSGSPPLDPAVQHYSGPELRQGQTA